MARPKGSKNKKNVMTITQYDAKIAALQEKKNAQETTQAELLADIEAKKEQLKATKKELRATEKALVALEEKRKAAEALAAASSKKKEIDKLVTDLISSGKTADEIFDCLKSLK